MPKKIDVSNFHTQYSDLTSQHWHAQSEGFAGGDNLITALEKKWGIEKCALVTHWYAGMRGVRIYEFTLVKGDKTIIMPVLNNPYVDRFIIDEGIIVAEEADVRA
ncbi:MAG: hypothetical protein Phog2KO_13020 [Phototrophicaceae bacterium]